MKLMIISAFLFSGMTHAKSFNWSQQKFVQEVMSKLDQVRRTSNNYMNDNSYDKTIKTLEKIWDCADDAKNEKQLKSCRMRFERIQSPR